MRDPRAAQQKRHIRDEAVTPCFAAGLHGYEVWPSSTPAPPLTPPYVLEGGMRDVNKGVMKSFDALDRREKTMATLGEKLAATNGETGRGYDM